MTAGTVLLIVLAAAAGLVLAGFAVVYVLVPVLKGIWWLIRHVARFIGGELADVLRFVGVLILSILYVPLVLGTIVIGRWSSSAHFGRALSAEITALVGCLYRIAIGHPARLLFLHRLTEGIEQRLPPVMAAAPGGDRPSLRTGLFEGYTIVGSLPAGGSGAKLYVAEPDAIKRAAFARSGCPEVDQVVIKSFSLHDGSSMPQIVRESRSLDAARRLCLILDHDLTPERFFYVMRYVPGESLGIVGKRLHAESPPDGLGDSELRAALGFAADLIAQLADYHAGGLWHKDVKPDNIIVTEAGRGGRAHLVDFGLVTSLGSAMTLTTHGTEYFRDPEMVRLALKGVKVHEVDGTKFDIYGAGAVLYSLIEDSFPAHGVLSEIKKKSPDAVKWIARRAMSDYQKRYQSAGQMLADVRYVLTARDMDAIRPADLPSMAGFGDAPAMPEPAPAPQAQAPTPMPPPGVQPDPAPAGRRSPRIRLVNWWSGATAVDGFNWAGVPAGAQIPGRTPEDWGRYAAGVANRSVAAAQEALGAFKASFTPRGAGSPGPVVGSPPPPVPAAAPALRRTAAEQLQAARARAAAMRERARARGAARSARPPTRRRFDHGVNAGVGVALLVFLSSLVGLGAIMAARDRMSERVYHAAAEASSRSEMARAAATIVGASAEHMSAGFPVAVPEMVQDAPEPGPAPVDGRVLIIVDALQPWSDEVADAVRTIEERLTERGITVLGTHLVGTDTDDDSEESVNELTASARLALGQAPAGSSEASSRLASWLSGVAPRVDSVVWFAMPTPESPVPHCTAVTRVSTPGGPADERASDVSRIVTESVSRR